MDDVAIIALAAAIMLHAALESWERARARRQWERVVERLFPRDQADDDAAFERDARWGES